ncbi:MAG: hypothetical protein AAFX62_10645, partial [Pseudomonadota bacterium]
GRVKFSRPGTALQRIFGRAETIQDEYLERLKSNRAALKKMSSEFGWRLVSHDTGEAALTGASTLHAALSEIGVGA